MGESLDFAQEKFPPTDLPAEVASFAEVATKAESTQAGPSQFGSPARRSLGAGGDIFKQTTKQVLVGQIGDSGLTYCLFHVVRIIGVPWTVL